MAVLGLYLHLPEGFTKYRKGDIYLNGLWRWILFSLADSFKSSTILLRICSVLILPEGILGRAMSACRPSTTLYLQPLGIVGEVRLLPGAPVIQKMALAWLNPHWSCSDMYWTPTSDRILTDLRRVTCAQSLGEEVCEHWPGQEVPPGVDSPAQLQAEKAPGARQQALEHSRVYGPCYQIDVQPDRPPGGGEHL